MANVYMYSTTCTVAIAAAAALAEQHKICAAALTQHMHMYCNTGVQDYSYRMDYSMRVPVALAQQHTYSIAAQLHSCSIGGAAE